MRRDSTGPNWSHPECSRCPGDGKCLHCTAFDIGSRIKRDRNWYPPRIA